MPSSMLKIAQEKAEEYEKEYERAEKRGRDLQDKCDKLRSELDASKDLVSKLQAEVGSGFKVWGPKIWFLSSRPRLVQCLGFGVQRFGF